MVELRFTLFHLANLKEMLMKAEQAIYCINQNAPILYFRVCF